MLIFCFCFSVVCSVSATNENGKYEDLFVERLSLQEYVVDGEKYYDYMECYKYYSSDDMTSIDESIPEFVLVFAATNEVGPMIYSEYIGSYVVVSYNCHYPDTLGYYIYIPSEDKIYTLKEAYDKGVEGIRNAFSEYITLKGMSGLLGDSDKDNELTIKDSTWIQKKIANINVSTNYDYEEVEFAIADYDKDGLVTIKDATAIQKYIAGLEY